MKLQIAYNEKNYTLSFTRASARNMSDLASKIKDKDDIVENADIMIRASLKAMHPALPKAEVDCLVDYIMNNCQLVDKAEKEGEASKKGLLTYLNEMVMECMPKGFTGRTADTGFMVVE